MFSGLRLRLTLLYLLAALALIMLLGVGTYWLLSSYFRNTTDLALQHKMAHEFLRLGARPPSELAAADLAWYTNRGRLLPDPPATPRRTGGAEQTEQDHSGAKPGDDIDDEESFDGELAAVFVLSLDAQGALIANAEVPAPPLIPNGQAIDAARMQGSDIRTGYLRDGSRARLLTYAVRSADGTTFVQAGRSLADQDRVLEQLLAGLISLGGASVVLLSASSWWLAGRSLRPAQQAWERQQMFVANASHELRTPLTLMRASAEVALRGLPQQDADRRELLGDVLNESDHMSRLVDELLLLSRIDAGELKVERQPIDLSDLLADVRRQAGRLADERGVHMSAGATDGVALGDPMRLRQVLLIVLDNALRHTQPGGSVNIEALSHGRQVEIVIADTGAGIAPAHLPHVFDRFYRADSARGSSGSGLGLSIARGLIEAQRGQIAIASELGKGTRVSVSLPRAETSA
jgi:signal transduction histidine kinase